MDLRLANLVHRIAIQFCATKTQYMKILVAPAVSSVSMEVADDIVRYVVGHEQSGTMKDQCRVGRQNDRFC